MKRQAPLSHLVAPPSLGGSSQATTRGCRERQDPSRQKVPSRVAVRFMAPLMAILLGFAGAGSQTFGHC